MRVSKRAAVLLALVAIASAAGSATGAPSGPAGTVATFQSGPPHDAGANGGAALGSGLVADGDGSCSFPRTIEDATGTEITVDMEPERIVTMGPDVAQPLWAFDASETVVGVTERAAFLEGAAEKTVVSAANGTGHDVDAIAELEPDLVLAPWDARPETVRTLRDRGLTVVSFERPRSFGDVLNQTRLVGALSGECGAANETVADMDRRVSAIRSAVADGDRPGALFVTGQYTVPEDSFVATLLETAGTSNVAPDIGVGHDLRVTGDAIANNAADIEWLVHYEETATHPNASVYDETVARQEGQVVTLDGPKLRHPAPHSVDALENLTRAVHPDAYDEAQELLASQTETPEGDGGPTTGTESADAVESETDGTTGSGAEGTAASGPGFTMAAALLATFLAGLRWHRR